MKKTLSILLTALLLCALCLTGCSSETAQKDVPIDQLSGTVLEAIGMADTMVDTTDVIVEGFMQLSTDQFDGCVVYRSSSGTSVDEFGLFKAGTLTHQEVKSAVEDYLDVLRETSMAALYTPKEVPKLEGAQVRAVGDYVMYCVLSGGDMDAAFDAFESALK